MPGTGRSVHIQCSVQLSQPCAFGSQLRFLREGFPSFGSGCINLLPDGRKLTVKAARFHKRMVLVTTAEIKSMNESELLRGMEVSINAEDLPELEEGRFYVADLIGLPVYDEQGEQIGTFKDALSTGSNDVYVIAVPGQKDYLLPALKKYVKEINLAEKRIVVELPEWVEAE